jgi:RNA polymerase sigma-70 factor (ECF subfamily)
MVERTNQQWLDDLRANDERQALALADLRALLASRLPIILPSKIPADRPDFPKVLETTIQYTLIYVEDHLHTFDGKSAFTTWVLKIAVRLGLLEIRQLKFQSASPAQPLPKTPRIFHAILAFSPFLKRLHTILREELTENQRIAIRAMVMYRMPKEEVARYLGLQRFDYFKMIHDARLRLKRRFELDGWFSKKTGSDV